MSYVIKIYAIRNILGGKPLRTAAWLGLIEPLKFFVFNLNAVLLALTVLLIPFAVCRSSFAGRIPRPLEALSISAHRGCRPLRASSCR
jgi:spermidine/putrescine transport system permease protein